jgi:hypothetical protein
MQTVHEANMKEFEALDDGDETTDSPLIRQFRVIKSSSRSMSEIDEILLQRDYTKEAFCILFQNGQAACIVQRGGRTKPGDHVFYLNDLIYHKDSQGVRIFDFKKQGFAKTLGEFANSQDKFLPIDQIATKVIGDTTLIAVVIKNMLILFKLEESGECTLFFVFQFDDDA